uniref:Uncharacterized protein n=1 Tax=Callorhinchus milii TaxID=7868 RepID=A0A4W3GNX7_CALMI
MSAHVRHICYFFDYGALSLYSLGRYHHSNSSWSSAVRAGSNSRSSSSPTRP